MLDAVHQDRDALYRFAFQILKNGQDAEDALQEAFLRILRATKTATPPVENPRAWAFKILRNICIDQIRRRKRFSERSDEQNREVSELIDASAFNPEVTVIASDALNRVTRAMHRLPPDEAEALSLVVVEGLSYADAAYITGTPIGTIRSRLHRARKVLKAVLEPEAPAETKKRDMQ